MLKAMGDKQRLPKGAWLKYNFGEGEACPAFGWQVPFRHAYEHLGAVHGKDKVGLGAVVFGTIPVNIATAAFGLVKPVDLALTMRQVTRAVQRMITDPDTFGFVETAYHELKDMPQLSKSDLGLIVVTEAPGRLTEDHFGLEPSADILNNLAAHAGFMLQHAGIEAPELTSVSA